MAYQIYTEVHLVPVNPPKQASVEKQIKCYPSNDPAWLSNKTKVINLPKGIQFPHAESIAEELLDKGFCTSFAITKTLDK